MRGLYARATDVVIISVGPPRGHLWRYVGMVTPLRPNACTDSADAQPVPTGWLVPTGALFAQTFTRWAASWGLRLPTWGRGGPALRGGCASRTATSRRARVTRGDK